MKIVRFLKNHSPYVAGETASFSNEDADVRINAGVAELVKEYEVQPDQRVVTKVDEDGHTVIETKAVADDLERNVDLPATEGGGQPKDEAHMTEAEKRRRLEEDRGEEEDGEAARAPGLDKKSLDQPRENKMVGKAPTKK